MGALLLVERGLLALDGRVSDYLPCCTGLTAEGPASGMS